MRTLVVIIIGIALAFLFNAVVPPRGRDGRRRTPNGSLLFIGLWLVACVVDLFVGVAAGHGFALELAIHALVYAVPAGLAWFLLRRSNAAGTRA